jgi:hypothetical protein
MLNQFVVGQFVAFITKKKLMEISSIIMFSHVTYETESKAVPRKTPEIFLDIGRSSTFFFDLKLVKKC